MNDFFNGKPVTLKGLSKKKKTLWEVLSNPPEKEIQGIKVAAWKVPLPEDRKEMVIAINNWRKEDGKEN